MTRTLLYVGLLHHVSSEGGKDYKYFARMFGLPVRRMESSSDAYLTEAEEKLAGYEIDKLYMDSQGRGGENAVKDLRQLKRQGSGSAGLALSIVKKGARPMKTESAPLLCEALEIHESMTYVVKETIKGKREGKINSKKQEKEINKLFRELSERDVKAHGKRNAYIERRIDMTLRDGETGVLLMGANHELGFKGMDVVYVVDPKKIVRETDREFFGRKRIAATVKAVLRLKK